MTEKEFAIHTYEQLLSNKIKTFSPYFFVPQYRKERVNYLIKYLIEEKLCITPEQALKIINIDLLRKYRLDIILQYIDRPSEFAENDLRYIVLSAYSELTPPKNKEQAIIIYKEVLAKKRKNFPKNYFLDGKKGEERAIACFRYLCENVLNLSPEEIIEKFSSSKGLQILSKYRLKIIMNVLFYSLSDLLESAYPNLLSKYAQKKEKNHA